MKMLILKRLCVAGLLFTAFQGMAQTPADRITPRDRIPGTKIHEVGARPAAIEDYPWMVALLPAGEADVFLNHFCSGVLIHPNWVLTAAHCVDGMNPSALDVVVRPLLLNQSTTGERRTASEILVYPGFSCFSFEHDIALVRLAEPVLNVGPIATMDQTGLASTGGVGRLLSWGNTNHLVNTAYPRFLQQHDLTVVPQATANADTNYNGTLSANMLAVGIDTNGLGICGRDSGAPLITRPTSNSLWRVAGISSFAIGTCSNSFGIFTEVYPYRQWILNRVLPDYLAWETFHGLEGERMFPLGRNMDVWGHYAFGQDPTGPGGIPDTTFGFSTNAGWSVTVPRPIGIRETSYHLKVATGFDSNLNFSALSSTRLSGPVTTNVLDGYETISGTAPINSGPTGLTYVVAGHEGGVLNQVEPFPIPGTVYSALLTNDVPFSRTYDLTNLPLSVNHQITVRSTDFDPVLELLAAGGVPLGISDTPIAAGPDESLLFSFIISGLAEQVRITSKDGNGGAYRLSIHPTDYTELPRTHLAFENSLTGALHVADMPDSTWAAVPGHVVDEYVVAPPHPPFQRYQLRAASTNFNPAVYVLDGETGLPLYGGNKQRDTDFFIWQADPARSYLLRVTSDLPGGVGDYELFLEPPVLNEDLAVNDTVNGTISTNLSSDPFVGGNYHYRDYTITGAASGTTLMVTLTSSDFPTYLGILTGDESTIRYQRDKHRGSTNTAFLAFNVGSETNVIRVRSSQEGGFGNFALSVSNAPTYERSLPPLEVGGPQLTLQFLQPDGISVPQGNPYDPDRVPSHYMQEYMLTGFTPGVDVAIQMGSNNSDSYLRLIDGFDGAILAEDDNSWVNGQNYARLVFTPMAGVEYRVRGTTAAPNDSGYFSIQALVAP